MTEEYREETIKDINYNETKNDENDEYVICRICNKKFKIITNSHLKKIHNMNIEEYRNKFPDAELVAKNTSIRRKNNLLEYHENKNKEKKTEEVKENTKEEVKEINLDKVPVIDEQLSEKITQKLKELDLFINKKIKEPIKTLSTKEEILNYLLTIFKDVKPNQFIKISTITNYVAYKFISDIIIPSKKIDLEFINVIWHNKDYEREYRNRILKENGWIIIEFEEKRPSVDDVIIKLKKYNLI